MSDTVVVAPPATEAQTEAAVEIAKIEAERDVKIAEIAANTVEDQTAAAIEVAEIEAEDDEDLAWLTGELSGLRDSLARLEAEHAEQRNQLQTLLALEVIQMAMNPPAPETPPPPSEPPPVENPASDEKSKAEPTGGDEKPSEKAKGPRDKNWL